MRIDYQTLAALAQAHGEGFWALDLPHFERTYRELLGELRARYAGCQLAYAYKANYAPRLAAAIDAQGGWAEVVSGLELQAARRSSVAPQRVIVNGPYRAPGELADALAWGALVNLDGPAQLAALAELAAAGALHDARVGLRVSFEHPDVVPSRFGFDADGPEAAAAARTALALPGVRLVALHCHVSTRSRAPATFAAIARRMVALGDRLFPSGGPELLDLGGGFCSRMPAELSAQFSAPVPTFAEYAAAVGGALAERWPAGDGPTVLLEPGVALAADAGYYVARVLEVRTLRSRRLALVAGSELTVKPTRHGLRLPVRRVACPAPRRPAVEGPLDLVGYTCMERDLLREGFPEPLAVGDFVVFGNVGAYTSVLSPPFIRPRPAGVGWDGARWEPLWRAQPPADVLDLHAR